MGFKMSRNRGKHEESGGKRQETEEDKMPRHEKHPPFRWVSIWANFYYKTGDVLTFLTQAYPPGGVRAIYIYMHAVELLTGPSLAFSKVINWSKFVFVGQNTIKIGVSAEI